MKQKLLYGGYYLSAMSTPADGGGFQSRVAIMVLSSERTRSQRFLDFECYETEIAANLHAIEGGKEWIDAQLKRDLLRASASFAAL